MRLDGATVLVTGGTGFLGCRLARELADAGADVAAVGRKDADLRDRVEVDRLLISTKPDAVVHLAAVVGGIGANQAEPGRFFFENALMGIQLIEACRIAGVPKTLVAGTVCSYPKHTSVPFTEAHLWDGYPEETNASYGLAKKMLLIQAQAYRQQYGQSVTFLLPVNLYGPGDNFDLETGHVVPSMVRRLVEARETGAPNVVFWGDGSPTREFLHVVDAARAFRLALEQFDSPEPVNVGSGEEIMIRDLADLVRRGVGYEGQISWDRSKPNGQPRRRLDTNRAYEAFGFRAEVPFEEGLAETIEWYENSTIARPSHTRVG